MDLPSSKLRVRSIRLVSFLCVVLSFEKQTPFCTFCYGSSELKTQGAFDPAGFFFLRGFIIRKTVVLGSGLLLAV